MPTIEEKREHAVTLLMNLGDTSAEVAGNLRSGGFTGIPDDSCNCPVARFLQRELGTVSVTVGSQAHIEDEDEKNGVDLPKAVTDFVNNFDDGDYPELEELTPPKTSNE